SRVGAFGYTIKKVGRASSFAFPQTVVYFPPRCDGVALRLAKQLGVAAKPLPGGTGACRLYVIVGPAPGPRREELLQRRAARRTPGSRCFNSTGIGSAAAAWRTKRLSVSSKR